MSSKDQDSHQKQFGEYKDNFRDNLSTVNAVGKRKWIFPLKPKGFYYNKRTIVSVLYYLIFFTLPFLKINGKPLFLLNIPKGKYVIFGKIFWPQDFLIFGLIMLAALLFIALFTMVFGRIFCGWICPQTVFMELLFRKIDYWILGDGAQQKRLHQLPFKGEKARKYTIRYIIYFLLSFLIANTFLSYIIGVDELWTIVTSPVSEHLGGFIAILFFTLAFFTVFAFVREQVCTNICPYGRLQGVLLDKDSVVVTYDYKRGEPRGKYAKVDMKQLGDCIDCNQCVNVCPTGIDIRNGTQLECTNCTACIDACNFMMEKVGRPTGLIRYDSENNIANGKKFKITGRIIGFSVALLAITTTIIVLLATRSAVGVKLMRSQGLTYQERGTDSISNLYNIKLENKTADTFYLTLKVKNVANAVEMVGEKHIMILPEAQKSNNFFIVLPKAMLKNGKNEIDLEIYNGDAIMDVKATTFLAPMQF